MSISREEVIKALDETEDLLVELHLQKIDYKNLFRVNRKNYKILKEILKLMERD